MRLISLIVLLSLPAAALAQGYRSAPLMVIDAKNAAALAPAAGEPAPKTPEEVADSFPKEAITHVGANPPAPAAPATPETPKTLAAPTPPAGPANKLWPRQTLALFLPSCTGLRVQYVAPCTCVITKLMVVMPHDEFLKKSEDGTLEQDARLKQIQLDCVTAVKQKD